MRPFDDYRIRITSTFRNGAALSTRSRGSRLIINLRALVADGVVQQEVRLLVFHRERQLREEATQ